MKSALDAAAAAAADDDDSQYMYHKHWLHAGTVCSASSLHHTLTKLLSAAATHFMRISPVTLT